MKSYEYYQKRARFWGIFAIVCAALSVACQVFVYVVR